ncbi:MAG: hypothetical protein WC858_06055 [Parcubacteria group bacterium]|jgi:hypothetical protein
MSAIIIGQTAEQRLLDLKGNPYRPWLIVKLQQEIEGEVRAMQLRETVTGVADREYNLKIICMKLDLEQLYTDWAEGLIQ